MFCCAPYKSNIEATTNYMFKIGYYIITQRLEQHIYESTTSHENIVIFFLLFHLWILFYVEMSCVQS